MLGLNHGKECSHVITADDKNLPAWICSTDPSHRHIFYSPSTGRDEGKQGHQVWWSLEESAASWATGNWKCTADALYMHPLPAPPAALTFVLRHAHTHSHVQAHRQRDGGKGPMNYGLVHQNISSELWKRHGINIWIRTCSVTKARQCGCSKIRNFLNIFRIEWTSFGENTHKIATPRACPFNWTVTMHCIQQHTFPSHVFFQHPR